MSKIILTRSGSKRTPKRRTNKLMKGFVYRLSHDSQFNDRDFGALQLTPCFLVIGLSNTKIHILFENIGSYKNFK